MTTGSGEPSGATWGPNIGTPMPPERSAYHHGDLRNALIQAAIELAREGGPDAIQLRAITRKIGVTPRAAYRHFHNLEALVEAASIEGFRLMALEMDKGVQKVCAEVDPSSRARARTFAVGRAYISFALHQSGLFETAFFGPATIHSSRKQETEGEMGLTPYGHLIAALEEMRDTGQIPAERLQRDATIAWSLVHGFSTLAIRGPLHMLPREEALAMGEDLVIGLIDGMSNWPSNTEININWRAAAATPGSAPSAGSADSAGPAPSAESAPSAASGN